MTEEEWKYYQELIKEFADLGGKEQFRDLFDVDEDGCISQIHPPLRKQVVWAAILFLQNLMINQRLRRVERWAESSSKN